MVISGRHEERLCYFKNIVAGIGLNKTVVISGSYKEPVCDFYNDVAVAGHNKGTKYLKTGQPLYVTDVLCCSARVAWAFAPSAREVTEIIFAEIELRNSVIYTSRGSRVEPRQS